MNTRNLSDLELLKSFQQVLSDLVLIFAVGESKSVGKAALALGYDSASAIRNRIVRLEKLLKLPVGTILAQSEPNVYRLTVIGEKLHRASEKIMPVFLETMRGLYPESDTLSFAAITSVWDYHRQIFREAAEGRIVDEEVKRVDHSDDIVSLVQNGSVDVGIITYEPRRESISRLGQQIWKQEPMVVAISKEAAKKLCVVDELVTDRSCHDWSGVAFRENFPIVMLQKGYGIRDESVDPFLRKIGQNPLIAAEYDNIAQIKEMVAAYPAMMTILPLPTVENDPRLYWAWLSDCEPRPVNFVFRENPRELVERFLFRITAGDSQGQRKLRAVASDR